MMLHERRPFYILSGVFERGLMKTLPHLPSNFESGAVWPQWFTKVTGDRKFAMALYYVLTALMKEFFYSRCGVVEKFVVGSLALRGKVKRQRQKVFTSLITNMYLGMVSHIRISDLDGVTEYRTMLFSEFSHDNRRIIETALLQAFASFLLRECNVFVNPILKHSSLSTRFSGTVSDTIPHHLNRENIMIIAGWAAFSLKEKLKKKRPDVSAILEIITCKRAYLVERGVDIPQFIKEDDLGRKTFLRPEFHAFQESCVSRLSEKASEIGIQSGMEPFDKQIQECAWETDDLQTLFVDSLKQIVPDGSTLPEQDGDIRVLLTAFYKKIGHRLAGVIKSALNDRDRGVVRAGDFRKVMKHRGKTQNAKPKKRKKGQAKNTNKRAKNNASEGDETRRRIDVEQ